MIVVLSVFCVQIYVSAKTLSSSKKTVYLNKKIVNWLDILMFSFFLPGFLYINIYSLLRAGPLPSFYLLTHTHQYSCRLTATSSVCRNWHLHTIPNYGLNCVLPGHLRLPLLCVDCKNNCVYRCPWSLYLPPTTVFLPIHWHFLFPASYLPIPRPSLHTNQLFRQHFSQSIILFIYWNPFSFFYLNIIPTYMPACLSTHFVSI